MAGTCDPGQAGEGRARLPLAGRSREVGVKILADREPAPPTGQPFELVEFENLTATPYVTDKGRMAYSLKATGIKAARPVASRDAA